MNVLCSRLLQWCCLSPVRRFIISPLIASTRFVCDTLNFSRWLIFIFTFIFYFTLLSVSQLSVSGMWSRWVVSFLFIVQEKFPSWVHTCFVIQHSMSSSPVVYSQQSEYLYQPTDGGPVQPPLPVMEDTTPEVPILKSSIVAGNTWRKFSAFLEKPIPRAGATSAAVPNLFCFTDWCYAELCMPTRALAMFMRNSPWHWN